MTGALPRGLGDEPGGAFYLHGADYFRKEEALRALIEMHLDPGTRDFNLDLLRGSEVDAETLASVLATPPMMAEWRVVVLREVEGLAGSKHAREVLLQTVSAPPPGLALLMGCTVPDNSKAKLYRDLARVARSVEFPAVTDADAPGWVIARAAEAHGCEVDLEAARALGSAVGNDLGVLARELEKLSEFVGERRRIGLDDVKAAGTTLPSQDRWKWIDLVAEGRFEDARSALLILLAQGESGVGLTVALASQLLRIGVVLERGARGLEAMLPSYQKWLAKTATAQARRWTPASLDHALDGLLEVDRRLKSTSHGSEHILETWLMELRVRAEAV